MPRDAGADNAGKASNEDIRWFDIEPCYVYHPLNAYSEIREGARGTEEVLVLDVVRYSRMFDRDRRGPGESLPSLDRWTINLATGAVSTECRDDRSQEFPRINENWNWRPAPVRLYRRHRRRGPRRGWSGFGVVAVQARLRHRIQAQSPHSIPTCCLVKRRLRRTPRPERAAPKMTGS